MLLFVPPTSCWSPFAQWSQPAPGPVAMEHILQTYASSSDDGGAEDDTPGSSVLGELPIELRSIFSDSGETWHRTSRVPCSSEYSLVPCTATYTIPTSTICYAAWALLLLCTNQLASTTPLCPVEGYDICVRRYLRGHVHV